MSKSLLVTLGTLLLIVTLAPLATAQSNLEKSGARSAAQRGLEAFETERWEDAIADFQRAEAVIHAPTHLLYIARAQAELGRLVDAWETYTQLNRERLASDAPAAFVEAKTKSHAEFVELDARVPRVTVVIEGRGAEGDDLEVLYDGEHVPSSLVGVPQPMDPGKHSFQAGSDHGESALHEVELSEGQEESIVLKLEPAKAPAAVASGAPTTDREERKGWSGMKVAGVASLAVGAVGATLPLVFVPKSTASRADADAAFEQCNPSCSASEQSAIDALDSDADREMAISIAGAAVGVAALATGVTLLILDGKKRKRATAARVTPILGFGWAGLQGSF